MVIIEEHGHTHEYYVRALRGQFGGNLASLIHETNKQVFMLRREQTPYFMSVPHNKIQTGKFYLINYDFNDNKLYCPIFTIDYRIQESNKHVLYAINLDYLPFDYKLLYFNKMYSVFQQIFEYNNDCKNFMEEKKFPVKFESIYNTLKHNGKYNFAISAFDITKIKECFGVSSSLMYIITHVHMRPVNVALMKEKMQEYEKGEEKRNKLQGVIDSLDDIVETYEEDVQSYYKKLRNIENNYKLFENK